MFTEEISDLAIECNCQTKFRSQLPAFHQIARFHLLGMADPDPSYRSMGPGKNPGKYSFKNADGEDSIVKEIGALVKTWEYYCNTLLYCRYAMNLEKSFGSRWGSNPVCRCYPVHHMELQQLPSTEQFPTGLIQ